ncbi:MAG: HTH domain-containing protein [Actinobacteria bacterium]|nr:HTH domain-containing protein [Actinomycetota bacterium]
MNDIAHDASTRARVLELIASLGPVSSAELAQRLELTTAGIRRHIGTLEHEGLITEHEPAGTVQPRRGRPARHYIATALGRAQLSSAYSDLAAAALAFLSRTAGDAAVEAFAENRVHDLEARYAREVEDAGADTRNRAVALADALTRDGYAATVRSVGMDGFALQLCQGHCPVLAVAHEFPQLCDAELGAFSRLLGVHVQRLATLAQGEHVCTTHIPVRPRIPEGTP